MSVSWVGARRHLPFFITLKIYEMKKPLTLLLIFLSVAVNAQHQTLSICEFESYNYQVPQSQNNNPADCTVYDNTIPTTQVYGIRVAKHTYLVTGIEEVHAIPFTENGNRVYYYYVNALYSSKEKAEQALVAFQYNGLFCDGWVRSYPITGMIFFTENFEQ